MTDRIIELPPLPDHWEPSLTAFVLNWGKAAIEADRQRNDNWRHAVMCAISHNDYETDAPRKVQQALRLLSDAFHGLPFRESIIDDLIAYRQRRSKPVAYAVFADNVNIRLWSSEPLDNPDAVPLYAGPQPVENAQNEPSDTLLDSDLEEGRSAIFAAANQWADIRAQYRTTDELQKANNDFMNRIDAELYIIQENATECSCNADLAKGDAKDNAYPTDEWVEIFLGEPDSSGFYHFRGDYGEVARRYQDAFRNSALQPAEQKKEVPDSPTSDDLFGEGFFRHHDNKVHPADEDDQHIAGTSIGEVLGAIRQYGAVCANPNATVTERTLRWNGIRVLLSRYGKVADPVKSPSKGELLRAIMNYADARAAVAENESTKVARNADRGDHDRCAQAYVGMIAVIDRLVSNNST